MSEVSVDLLDAARSVEMVAPMTFLIHGATYIVPAPAAQGERQGGLVSVFAQALYSFYCGAPARADASRAVSASAAVGRFVDDLAGANGGHGTWDPGWRVVAIEHGGRIVASKDHITLWISPAQFELPGAELCVGAIGRVAVGKEFRSLIPGFYFALGDGRQPDVVDDGAPLVRYYWHVTAAGAPLLMSALTRGLNREGVPFRLKMLRDPQGYVRADAAVLYLAWAAHLRAGRIITRVHARVARWLRPSTPRFSQPIGVGLGVAEDPGGEFESFGQNRCRIVAEGLCDALGSRGWSPGAREQAVVAAFVRHGLDPARPHLAKRDSGRVYAALDVGGAP
jgi:hypothetical protein